MYLCIHYGLEIARQHKLNELWQKRLELKEGTYNFLVIAPVVEDRKPVTIAFTPKLYERIGQYKTETKCTKRDMIEQALRDGYQKAIVELNCHNKGRTRDRFQEYIEKVISKDQ